MTYDLTLDNAVSITTYGVLLHTGAAARRQFNVAVVSECVEHGASFDDVSAAIKEAIDYDGMEQNERSTVRKELQFDRAIVAGWSKLGKRNQEAFVSGSLPASSAAKAIKAKAAPKADADAPPASADADPVTMSQPSGAEVITASECLVHAARFLDNADAATMSEAESKAVLNLIEALASFKARTVEAAAPKLLLAA